MKNKDIAAILADLSRRKWELENALEENGGDLTPELLQECADIDELKDLLEGEGIDSLGRQLKAVQDEREALKAEADTAARKVKNAKAYEDYLKWLIGKAMDALGADKVKGAYYGFKRGTSTKGSVNTEAVDAAYLDAVTEAARNAGLPSFLDVAITTNVTRLREWAQSNGAEGVADFLVEETAPSLTFNKPRANTQKTEA